MKKKIKTNTDLWTGSTGCLVYIWLGISYRFILIAFHQFHAMWNIHLSTGNSNHVYTDPAPRTWSVLLYSVSRISNAKPPKKMLRRWNQHVRFFVERGKTLNNLFNKNILLLRQMNTLKSAFKQIASTPSHFYNELWSVRCCISMAISFRDFINSSGMSRDILIKFYFRLASDS